jgi:hypothetical protein
MAKAKLSKLNDQLNDPAAKPAIKAKVVEEKPVEKKKPVAKAVAPVQAPVEEPEPEPTAQEGQVPRGQRGDFLQITIKIPADMLTELRILGMKRKSKKMKDTDTSALVREALVDFLKKHREN